MEETRANDCVVEPASWRSWLTTAAQRGMAFVGAIFGIFVWALGPGVSNPPGFTAEREVFVSLAVPVSAFLLARYAKFGECLTVVYGATAQAICLLGYLWFANWGLYLEFHPDKAYEARNFIIGALAAAVALSWAAWWLAKESLRCLSKKAP